MTSDAEIFAWGENDSGQPGDGSLTSRNVPGSVKMDGALAGKTVVAIEANGWSAYALTADGMVYSWGANGNGQLGDGSAANRNVQVAVKMDGVMAGRKITSLAVGQFGFCLALAGGAPEIAVEAPPGTQLVDGAGSTAFAAVLTGASSSREFTVRNTGGAPLSGIQASITGAAAADFSITSAPSGILALPGTTSFTVRFALSAADTRSAVLRIAGNDADENPFDITLTGRGLAPDAADDGDGLTNAAEVLLAGSGADPLTDNTALVAQLRAAGLYRAADMGTMQRGSLSTMHSHCIVTA